MLLIYLTLLIIPSITPTDPTCNKSDEPYPEVFIKEYSNQSQIELLSKKPLGDLEVVCVAKYPVQWSFRSFQLWTPWTVSTERKNESMFEATLLYQRLRNITQLRNDYPTCHKSGEECVQTSISVASNKLKITKGSDLVLNPNAEFGKNANCSLRFAYDEESQIFYCQAINYPKQIATAFPRTCSNPMDCSKVYMKSEENCPGPTLPYSNCTFGSGCVKITWSQDFLPAVAICLIRGSEDELPNSAAIPFFYSLDKKRYLRWSDVNPLDMMKITKLDNEIYAGQEFSIECSASYYYFSAGLIFLYDENIVKTLLNATLETTSYQQTTGKNGVLINLQYEIILSNKFAIYDNGTFEIKCKAPVWNTTEWIETKTVVTVIESYPPIFLDENDSKTIYDSSIKCSAKGVPKPNFVWTYNDAVIPSIIRLKEGEDDNETSWSSISYSKGIYGNFTCTAENYAGSITKTFVVAPHANRSIIVTALVILSLLFIVVLFLLWKVKEQRKQIKNYMTDEEVKEFLLGRPDFVQDSDQISTYAYYLPYDKSFEIERSDLEIDFNKVLGSGAYGIVVVGKYTTSVENNISNVIQVAVKTTKPLDYGLEMFKALLSELKIMAFIGRHENIVNLVGACTSEIQKKIVYIAMEYCENGSLATFLRSNRHTFLNQGFAGDCFLNFQDGVQYVKMEDLSNFPTHSYENLLSQTNLLRWALEIAEGMKFLNGKKVIHGDLAARNILLGKNLKAKICDFGLSKKLNNSYTSTALTPLPFKWLAIECLQHFQFSAESDIWSYGITLWEVFSLGEIPYSNFTGSGEEFLKKLSLGMRLSKPDYCSKEVFDIIMQCWRHDRKQRPSFNSLTIFFKAFLDRNLE